MQVCVGTGEMCRCVCRSKFVHKDACIGVCVGVSVGVSLCIKMHM